ncbi:MAG: cytochrome-c peroxidase [Planctomycetes bacterium]|nr:cytochrome-c peroxidase [Planctomycetota bacterium]
MRGLHLLLLVLGGAACATTLATPLPVGTEGGDAAALRLAYTRPSADWPPATIDPGVAFVELGPVPKPKKVDDPAAAAAIELGKLLFFDPRLSGTGEMACASCHDPDLGFADGRTTSFGHGRKVLRRNAPSVLNAGFLPHLFWDGRAASLGDQALMVFENADEMHSDGATVVAKLASSRGYRARFLAAFGDEEPTLERALAALAAYERTLVSDGSSAFDRFLAGDTKALDDSALRGLHLFRTKARCANCHHGPLLTDFAFHDLGLSYYGRGLQDLGRHAVTGDPADVGRFKTPSLRNVARTAPYMHNGLFDLASVVNMYSAGMATLRPKPEQQDDPLFPQKSPLLQRLDLTVEEKGDLIAFLEALNERKRRVRAPELPPIGDVAR